MGTLQQLDDTLPEARSRKASLWFLLPIMVVLATTFIASERGWDLSLDEDYSLAPDEAETLVDGGQGSRKISYTALGCFGLILLMVPSRYRLRLVSFPFLLALAYLLLCMASLAWSDAPWLTTKRVAVLMFSLLGVLGLSKHLSQRDLIVVALGTGMLLLAVGISAEITAGSFRPWLLWYRFSGTFHPNTQASYCAVMALAAFFGWKASERKRWLYALLFMIAAGFLLLTKSRNSIAACFVSIFAAWYVGSSNTKKTLVGIAVPFLVCGIALAGLLIGLEVLTSVDTAVQLGRGSDAGFGTLNGRLPLWNSLLGHIAERPLLGYGYHGFWTGERIYEISTQQEWTVPTAHSGYLDIVLSLGLLGGVLFASVICIALRHAAARCLATGANGGGFAFSMIVFAMASAVFESGFLQPSSFDAFVAACAVCQVLLQTSRFLAPSVEASRVRSRIRSQRPAFVEPLRLDPFPTGEAT